MVTPFSKKYTSSRAKTVAYLFVSLAFVAIAIFLADTRSQSNDWRYWCGSLFGVGTVVFVWLLARPQILALDAEGFTLSGGLMRTPKMTRWDEVDRFFVYRLPRGGKMVGFNFTPGSRPSTPLMDLNRRLGAEGALPKLWSGSPEALVDELNSYRSRFAKV
ncbi:MAG: hypothetical protein JWQ16_958 [Novosphingobium sp.]|nr:hypothetical protein [Novosphingobium sp.]